MPFSRWGVPANPPIYEMAARKEFFSARCHCVHPESSYFFPVSMQIVCVSLVNSNGIQYLDLISFIDSIVVLF